RGCPSPCSAYPAHLPLVRAWGQATACFPPFPGAAALPCRAASIPGLGHEAVAAAPDGLDALRMLAAVIQLAAQARDAHVHAAVQPVILDAADIVVDLVAAQHPAGVLRQQAEQLELVGGELHRLAVQGRLVRAMA